jgi:hypothetical protein
MKKKKAEKVAPPTRATLPLTERSLLPLCIRFRDEDLEVIRVAAARNNEAVTVFIREAALVRVVRQANGLEVPPLKYEVDGNLGKPYSIRFRPADFKQVSRCAAAEDRSATAWVRAVAIEFARRPQLTRRQREERAIAVGE